jgi:hypothetical protein
LEDILEFEHARDRPDRVTQCLDCHSACRVERRYVVRGPPLHHVLSLSRASPV